MRTVSDSHAPPVCECTQATSTTPPLPPPFCPKHSTPRWVAAVRDVGSNHRAVLVKLDRKATGEHCVDDHTVRPQVHAAASDSTRVRELPMPPRHHPKFTHAHTDGHTDVPQTFAHARSIPHLYVYLPFRVRISGAMYSGVPARVPVVASSSSFFARPKSVCGDTKQKSFLKKKKEKKKRQPPNTAELACAKSSKTSTG